MSNPKPSPSATEWRLLHDSMDKIDQERRRTGGATNVNWVAETIRTTYERQGILVAPESVERAIHTSLALQPAPTTPHRKGIPGWGRLSRLLSLKPSPQLMPNPHEAAKKKLQALLEHRLWTDGEIVALLEADIQALATAEPRQRAIKYLAWPVWVASLALLGVAGVSLVSSYLQPMGAWATLSIAMLPFFFMGLALGTFFKGVLRACTTHDATVANLHQGKTALEGLLALDYRHTTLCLALRRLGVLGPNSAQPEPVPPNASLWNVARKAVENTPELTPVWRDWLESHRPIRTSDIWRLEDVSSSIRTAKQWDRQRQSTWALEQQAHDKARALKSIMP